MSGQGLWARLTGALAAARRKAAERPALAVGGAAAVLGLAALALAGRPPGSTVWAPFGGLFGVGVPRLDAPAPAEVEDGTWVPDLPPSSLAVPISYDLADVIEALERAVPVRYGGLDDRRPVGDDGRTDVAFEIARTPFEAELRGDEARLSTVIRYRGRAWYDPPVLPTMSASCGTGDGEALPRATVALSARIRLNRDWQLEARTEVDRVAAVSEATRDRCRVTALRIDVTDHVLSAARELLESHTGAIDQALAAIDLRSRFERWWGTLLEPIELTDQVWLVIAPYAVHRGQVVGQGRRLTAEVGLTARPRVVLGERPVVPRVPLPPLDSAAVGEALHILAEGWGDYDEVARRLTERLRGQELERDGRVVRIQELGVSGVGGGRLALEMTFSGSARGRIFFTGTPRFDPRLGEVTVPDLELDVASANVLVSGMAWLAEAGVEEFLRARARWSVDDFVAFVGTQLDRGLNRRLSDDVQLQGGVDEVRILGVYPTRRRLVVQAEAVARAAMIVSADATTEDSVEARSPGLDPSSGSQVNPAP